MCCFCFAMFLGRDTVMASTWPFIYPIGWNQCDHSISYRVCLLELCIVYPDIVKLLEENKGKNTVWHWSGSNFLAMSWKAQATKAEIIKQYCITLKTLCLSKEIINKVKKKTHRSRQNISKPCIYSGVNIPHTFGELKIFSNQKTNISIEDGQRTWKDISQKKMQIANWYMKKNVLHYYSLEKSKLKSQ
jgi:hypothetical protein